VKIIRPTERRRSKSRPIGNLDDPNRQYLVDFSHEALIVSEPHWRLPNGAWSGGGPFYVHKSSRDFGPIVTYPFQLFGPRVSWATGGVMAVVNSAPAWIPTSGSLAETNWSNLKDIASSHWLSGFVKARPGNPVASLGQFVYELKELPSIPYSGGLSSVPFRNWPRHLLRVLSDFRNLGSEYLNYSFGWKPFVGDLRKMYNLWKTIDKRMAQIVRENGRSIRRRATLVNERSRNVELGEGLPGAWIYGWPYLGGGYASIKTTRIVEEDVWFVGKFQYYIPDTSSSMWNAKARAALFGVLPTPELIWNVLPWSWLIDWFSDMGDFYSYFSANAVDNLVCHYSYVMRRWKARTEYSVDTNRDGLNAPPFAFWPNLTFSFSTVLEDEIKMRYGGGNPFGLNVKLDSLSGHQLAILAALGISRSKVR